MQSGNGSIWTFDRKSLSLGIEFSIVLCQGRCGIRFSLTASLNSIKGGGASELHLNCRLFGIAGARERNGVLKIEIDGAKVQVSLPMGILPLGILKTSQTFPHASMTNYS